jgi:hypothetical protein
MLFPIGEDIKVQAFYTKDGVGYNPSSAPTVAVTRNGVSTGITSGSTSAGAITGERIYTIAGATTTANGTGVYFVRWTTSDTTVDQQDLPSLIYVVDWLQASVVKSNVKQVDDDALAAVNMEAFFDDEGFNATASVIGQVSVIETGGISASSIQNGALTNAKFDGGFWNKIADHVLRRSLSSAAASADGDSVVWRSPLGALRRLVNRSRINGSNLQIYAEDDATVVGTFAVTNTEGADPITEVDPT